jgi:hypothetical protein
MSFSSVAEHAVFNFDLIGLLLCPALGQAPGPPGEPVPSVPPIAFAMGPPSAMRALGPTPAPDRRRNPIPDSTAVLRICLAAGSVL